MTKIIRVVNAAISPTGATLYTEDGQTHTVSSDDHRVVDMIDKIYLAIKENRTPIEVDISNYTVFDVIEKNTGGFMKFFRVAKAGIEKLLGTRAERSDKISKSGFHTGVGDSVEVAPQPGTEPVTQELREALSEAHQSALDTGVKEADTTIVAVIGDMPIVGAERLQTQAKAAVRQGNTKPFENMMKRLASVASERKHTAQEAMVFLEKMDLPPTLDGSILAYKSLSKSGENFVDNHSRKLKQNLGTLVQMDVELVDDNRRTLCSNGLHVAQKGYLGSYGTSNSNVVCLIKIAPEDVISVPIGETQKMRVRAYHIIAVLSNNDLHAIRSQKSITKENPEGSAILGKLVNGDHVGILNITTQHKGGVVDQMIPVESGQIPIKQYDVVLSPEDKPIIEAHTLDGIEDTPNDVKKVDVKTLNENIIKNDIDKVGSKAVSKAKAKATLNQKKKGKSPVKTKPKASPKERKSPKITLPIGFERKSEPVNAPATQAQTKRVTSVGKSKIRLAFEAFQATPSESTYSTLLYAKTTAKKSWNALGFSLTEVALIESYKK